MSRRLELHKKLCDILGCPETGTSCRAYFQPPSSVKMQYPAIVYSLDDVDSRYANDVTYLTKKRYAAIVVDKNPDTDLIDKMLSLPMCSFNRSYTRDNLNHFVFEIYY
jgi:hypothetical protein